MDIALVSNLGLVVGILLSLLFAIQVKRNLIDPTAKYMLYLATLVYIAACIASIMAVGRIQNYSDLYKNAAKDIFPLTFLYFCYSLVTRKELGVRNQAEQRLRESADKLRTIFNTAGDAIFIRDPEGTILEVNRAACSLLGYSQEELLQLKLFEINLPQYASQIPQTTKKIEQCGHLIFETALLAKDGKSIPVEISSRPIAYEEVSAILSIVRDITSRKKAEEAAYHEKEKFRVVAEEAPVGISLIGEDGRCKYINPRHIEIFGYTLADIPSAQEWFQKAFPDQDYRDMVIAHWTNELKESKVYEPRPRTFNVRCKDESEKVIYFRSVTLGTGDQLVICEDITKQTQLEAQLRHAQKMEAIGTLTAGITHDFNNLLQVIQGYSELLLLDKTESDDDYGNLSEILGVTKMGGELTRKLLTFGRGIESKLRPVDLNYEIMQLQSLLKRTISKMIEFELCLAENLSPVNADTSQLEQIIMNLAINARDAMPQGGRLIIETKNVALDEDYWSTHPETKPGKYVVIAVSDTGCGMDEETLQHIFEPFFTTKKVGEGTGLGMAVVYGIVKSHAGHITCYSEPGVGTTFKIYLPAIEQVLKHPDPDDGYELHLQGTETILLVDDEENIIRLAEQGLSCFGYSVIAATNGEVALELYKGKNSQIDLIVLDLIMPGMGGLKCLEELLKINPQAKIVIASGCAVDGMPKCVLEAGAKTFIPKPFRLEEMAKEIRNVLDQK